MENIDNSRRAFVLKSALISGAAVLGAATVSSGFLTSCSTTSFTANLTKL